MEDLEKVALLFQIERRLKSTSKNCLCLLEDIFSEHDVFISKLLEVFPDKERDILLLNPLTEERFSRARKRILDNLGDNLRNLEN